MTKATKSILEEAFDLVVVRRDPYSGYYYLEMPGIRAIQSLYNDLGIRAPVPDYSDQFWSDLRQMVNERMTTLRSIADQLTPLVGSPSSVPAATNSNSTTTGDEARVRSMNADEAISAARSMGLQFQPHETNKGLSAMRAKNALYAAFRKGQQLRAHVRAADSASRNPWPGAKRRA